MNKHIFPLEKGKNGKFKPKIPIRIINYDTHESIIVNALIDTGADICILPSMVSRTIGCQLTEENKRPKGIKGITGIEVDTYTHGFYFELLDVSRTKTLRRLEVVGHSIITNDLPPIVGTEFFLERFKVSIDYLNEEIEIFW